MKRTVLLVAALTPLLFAARTFAQEEEVTVQFDTYCWNNQPTGDLVACVENGRFWAGATNLPKPMFDPNDPNMWPSVVENYFTTNTVSGEDRQRCIDTVHADENYADLPEDKIFVGCGVEVFAIAPLGLASGTFTVGLGDPIEHGIVRNPDGTEWRGVLAWAQGISCGCLARVPPLP